MQREQRTADALNAGLLTRMNADSRIEPDSLAVGGFVPTRLASARLAGHEPLGAALARTILDRRGVHHPGRGNDGRLRRG